MAFSLEDLLYGLRRSRRFFHRHLVGLTDEQLHWKPYPECKSVRETLVHLIGVDRSVLESMKQGAMPGAWEESLAALAQETVAWEGARLAETLEASHAALVAYLEATYHATALDTVISMWGDPMPLGRAVPYLSSEDYYHAGQVAYIRIATDPGWDYYAAVYGPEP